jgi:hypothetical protein
VRQDMNRLLAPHQLACLTLLAKLDQWAVGGLCTRAQPLFIVRVQSSRLSSIGSAAKLGRGGEGAMSRDSSDIVVLGEGGKAR